MAVDPAFLCYAAGSRHLADVDDAEQLAEVKRTLDALAAAQPAAVARGLATEEQSKTVLFLWLAIANDLEAAEAWAAEYRAQPSGCDLPHWSVADRVAARGDGFTWAVKVEAVQRELANRRSTYPALVDKGQLTADVARAQLERLEAVHAQYLLQGFAFDGSEAELRELADTMMQCGGSSSAERPANQPEDGGATPPSRSTAAGAPA